MKKVWQATTRWAVTPRQQKIAAYLRDEYFELGVF
jgi:hypothetical protein